MGVAVELSELVATVSTQSSLDEAQMFGPEYFPRIFPAVMGLPNDHRPYPSHAKTPIVRSKRRARR